MKKSLQMIRKRSHHWMIMMLFLFLGINVGYAANEKLPSIGTVETNVNSNAGITEDRSWTIQGQVFEQSEPPYPLAGVNISIKGTQQGTISDNGGYFSIKAKRGDIIVFTYLGFKNYEYVVSRAISNLNVSLVEDIEALDEVVVTGFSEEKKLNSISSISSLNVSSNLLSKPVTSVSQALQGGITGLSVNQSSGLPGADAATIKSGVFRLYRRTMTRWFWWTVSRWI